MSVWPSPFCRLISPSMSRHSYDITKKLQTKHVSKQTNLEDEICFGIATMSQFDVSSTGQPDMSGRLSSGPVVDIKAPEGIPYNTLLGRTQGCSTLLTLQCVGAGL
jgi:hypothetical protein